MSHIFLTGFMGAGKSTVGRLVAERLGRPYIDLDALIVEREGVSVTDIFRERGEGGFRQAEHDALASLGASPDSVVATGGGVILHAGNRAALAQLGTVVYLAVTPEEAIARLGDAADRPLLAGGGLSSARTILEARVSLYTSTADHVVDTVGRSADAVATGVISATRTAAVHPTIKVTAAEGAGYDVLVGPDLVGALGRRVSDTTGAAHTVLVSDETVFGLIGEAAVASLESSGIRVSTCVVPPGERSKSWAVAGGLLEELAATRADRTSCVVALGGGVVGDLAGFCAAVYMRGIPVIQVPTTVLAQVDSSIGGKTGVDLVAGKNLAGAFWPPRLVLADTATLQTLPDAEWTNGLVEAAKAALLQGDEAFDRFESRVPGLLAHDPDVVRLAVSDAAAFKATVVSADLREAGVRECLNLGHTLGHALEVTAGYERLPHGLAVAEGMRFAAVLSEHALAAPSGLTTRVSGLLDAIGASREAFVDRISGVRAALTPDVLLRAMKSDKKARAGVVRFVLVEHPGDWRAVPVDDDVVLRMLARWRDTMDGEA